MLLFYIRDDRYALECHQVVEVVPMVALKKLHHVLDYVAGLLNYRGRIVPVIDLCHLIRGERCRSQLSTRIILVNYKSCDQTVHILGLMAERVIETLDKPETEFIEGTAINAVPYLGKLIIDEQGMIQCLRVEHLLPLQPAYLLPDREAQLE